MNCTEAVKDILSRLDADRETPNARIELWNECQKLLQKLPSECSDELSQVGNNLLDQINNSSESLVEIKLLILLWSMVARKQPEAFNLITEALLNEHTLAKERYVDLLDDLEDRRAEPFLISAIESNRGVKTGEVRFKAIRALLSLNAIEGLPTIMSCITDPVDKVRNIALKFLVQLDIRQASDIFVTQLAEEDDPDNVELLVEGIVNWQRVDALPTLKQLLDSQWAEHDEDLGETLADAIKTLEQAKS